MLVKVHYVSCPSTLHHMCGYTKKIELEMGVNKIHHLDRPYKHINNLEEGSSNYCNTIIVLPSTAENNPTLLNRPEWKIQTNDRSKMKNVYITTDLYHRGHLRTQG